MRPVYPPVEPGITRVSSSEAEAFLRCGIRVGLERETKHRRATIPMVIGSAVSYGAAFDNGLKLMSGNGADLSQIVECTVEGYEAELVESEVEASKLELGQGKDQAADAGRVYGTTVSPKITKVLAAEEPIVAMVSSGLELVGTPDVITPDGIGDTKVGRERRQDEADKSRQLSIYALLHFSKFGTWPARVWLDSIHPLRPAIIDRKSTMWKADRVYSHRGMEDHARTIKLLEYVRKGIESGVELPPPEMGSWWCSAKWCPHYGTDCPIMGKKGL
jgi:hypothetical protein